MKLTRIALTIAIAFVTLTHIGCDKKTEEIKPKNQIKYRNIFFIVETHYDASLQYY